MVGIIFHHIPNDGGMELLLFFFILRSSKNKLAKIGDVIAISKSETTTDWLNNWGIGPKIPVGGLIQSKRTIAVIKST